MEITGRLGDGEGVDFGEDGDGGLDGGDGGDGEGAAAVFLADLHALRVLLQVGDEAAEHGRLIVGFVALVDEIKIHRALL